MGNTVLMSKNGKFADIFDSLETIDQAQKDGYHLCTNEEVKARNALLNEKQAEQTVEAAKLKSLSELSKNKLLKFAEKRNIFDESFKELDQGALVLKIIEVIKTLVVKAGLKTIEEADILAEIDLLALFDTFPNADK